MANEKTFKYKIVTQVDGSALKSLETSLKSVTSSIDAVSNNFKKLGNTIDSALKGSKSQIDTLISSLKGVVTVFGAIGLAKSALSAVWDFGKMTIEAAKFKQTMISSLDIFYKGQSQDILKNSIKVAGLTAADTRPLLEYVQDLASSGFSANQLKKLEVLRADVESAGGGQSTLDSMANVFKVAAGGGAPELGADYIQKFLGKTNYVRYQAKAAGVKDWQSGNVDTLNKQVNDARKAGKLSGSAMVQGIEEATLAKMGQSKIGDYSRKIAEGSIAGAMSNLSSTLDDMFLSIDLDKLPGIEAFRKFIVEIGTTLRGPEFQGALKDFIEGVFSPFKSLNEGDAKKAMLWILDTAKEIWTWLGKAYEFLKRLLFTDTAGALKDILVAQKDVFVYLGNLIGQGIKETIVGKEGSIKKWIGFDSDEDNPQPGSKGVTEYTPPSITRPNTESFRMDKDTPNNWVMNINVHGDADPKEIGKEVSTQTTAAMNKAQSKKNERKAGLSN